jgi:DNA-binding MarR family transcriptional regulator
MAPSDLTALDELNFNSLLAVLQTGMWLQSDIERYLAEFGLSHGRFSILLAIMDSSDEALIGKELAIRLGVSRPTITKMIEKLGEEGFLSRSPDDSDLRSKRFALTGKARKLLDAIIPGYLARLRVISAGLSGDEKQGLITVLSRINFLDPNKSLVRRAARTISEKSDEIKALCARGGGEAVDQVMAYLDEDVDLPTTKVIDYYLGTVRDAEGIKRIERYLFSGTPIQRNYCTLFFARRDEWRIVNKAYAMGLIDHAQAYSK